MLQFNSIGMIGSIQRGAAHGGSITKGLYSGVDPSALNELVYEFDVHIYLKDNI